MSQFGIGLTVITVSVLGGAFLLDRSMSSPDKAAKEVTASATPVTTGAHTAAPAANGDSATTLADATKEATPPVADEPRQQPAKSNAREPAKKVASLDPPKRPTPPSKRHSTAPTPPAIKASPAPLETTAPPVALAPAPADTAITPSAPAPAQDAAPTANSSSNAASTASSTTNQPAPPKGDASIQEGKPSA